MARCNARAVERRRQLLDVALAVFADRGFHSSSMDDIATAAGQGIPLQAVVANIGITTDFSALYTPNAGPHTAFVQVSLNEHHRVDSYEYMRRVRERMHHGGQGGHGAQRERGERCGGPAREVIQELAQLGLFGMHLDGYGLPGASAVAYGGCRCSTQRACGSAAWMLPWMHQAVGSGASGRDMVDPSSLSSSSSSTLPKRPRHAEQRCQPWIAVFAQCSVKRLPSHTRLASHHAHAPRTGDGSQGLRNINGIAVRQRIVQ